MMKTRRPIGPAALAVALLLSGLAHGGEPQMYYTFNVTANNADVSVVVNGVQVELFTAGQSGGGPMNHWMWNGSNEVAFEVRKGEGSFFVSAMIERSTADGYETLAEFQWPDQKAPAIAKIEAEGLPDWAWLRAEEVADGEADVRAAVAALHKSLDKDDEGQFRELAAALYADTEILAGKDRLEESHRMMWKNFRKDLQPLGELTVEAHRSGQIYSVTGTDGLAPIQSKDDDGGMFSMGKWWGRVDGSWQVVK